MHHNNSTIPLNLTVQSRIPEDIPVMDQEREKVHEIQRTANEQRVLNDEYKIWRKNVPFLYDVMMNQVLQWPSLTIQIMQDIRVNPDDDTKEISLLFGTHMPKTTQSKNYVMIAHCKMPFDEVPYEATHYDDKSYAYGGFGEPRGEIVTNVKVPHDGEVNRARVMPQNSFIFATKAPGAEVFIFDWSKVPSDGLGTEDDCAPMMKLIGHDSEGYGLAWSPHKPGYVLSGSEDRVCLVWDINSTTFDSSRQPLTTTHHHHHHHHHHDVHRQMQDEHEGNYYQQPPSISMDYQRQNYYQQNSFGSFQRNSMKLSPDNRKMITSSTMLNNGEDTPRLRPLQSYHGHQAVVEDVAWHPQHAELFASVGDDGHFILWDLRRNGNAALSTLALANVSESSSKTPEVNAVAWSPFSSTLIATGGTERVICLWDLRCLRFGRPLYVLGGDLEQQKNGEVIRTSRAPHTNDITHVSRCGTHLDEITQLGWSPNASHVFYSASSDRRIHVWDLANVDDEHARMDDGGPPELAFIHAGHSARISDFSIAPHIPFCVASVSEDNVIQIWQIAENLMRVNVEEKDMDGERMSE
ncbi:hypothetical protein SNEBB_007639 [Seison nebaliae]|nr:hypothetical protein SNEBB_007639 [Seison nebaliae]